MYNNCPKCGSYNQPGTEFCDCGHRFEVMGYRRKMASQKREHLLYMVLRRFSIMTMLVCSLVFLISFPQRDTWPDKSAILPELFQAPVQNQLDVPAPFEISKKEVTYEVTPLYNYELFGLVVTYHHSDSLTDVLHEKWNDFLNIKDICVVWGPNIESEIYKEVEFTSGNFTCFCKWDSPEIGRKFNGTALSNNHLLSADPKISRKILETRRGDQVYLKGYLSRYENPRVGFSRGTSTVRDDTGNGACETIFVTNYEVLKQSSPVYRFLFTLSWFFFSVGLVLFVSLAFLFPQQK